ncbi:MAG TPA: hypothetical protein VM925_33245, partial [Labilithrix sp.]|nr:hypothetical protein [Labilithrix sp.]
MFFVRTAAQCLAVASVVLLGCKPSSGSSSRESVDLARVIALSARLARSAATKPLQGDVGVVHGERLRTLAFPAGHPRGTALAMRSVGWAPRLVLAGLLACGSAGEGARPPEALPPDASPPQE